MKVLIAPCSFKESLTSSDAAHALARAAASHGHAIDLAPLADGGEGTLDALARALALRVEASVIDPMLWPRLPHLRRMHRAPYGVGGVVGVVESAHAIGIGFGRDPLRASSRGLGQLMNACVRAGARTLYVGLGGTGTVDGGAGMRETFVERDARVVGLVDVDVPLAGARMFMAQKGADAAAIEELSARLDAMYGADVAAVPGAGAAGGIGAAIVALGGALLSGATFVMDALDIEARIARADLVLTGEGRVDEQTGHGKLVAKMKAACAKHGKRCLVFAGASDVAGVHVITPPGTPLTDALAHAAANLERAARAALLV